MKILIIAGSFFLLSVMHGQEIKLPFSTIGFTQGFGYYFQSDLKDVNKEVSNSLPFEVVTVNNFPVRVFWGGYLAIPLGIKVNIGLNYGFHSTGSRIGQKDYSGSYTFDQILTSHALSIYSDILLSHTEHLRGYFNLNVGADIASWEIREKLNISSVSQNDEVEFRAVCPFVEPALILKRQFNHRIGLSLRAGYHLSFTAEYHHPSNNNIKTEMKPGWSGPRLSFNLDYNLYNEYKNKK